MFNYNPPSSLHLEFGDITFQLYSCQILCVIFLKLRKETFFKWYHELISQTENRVKVLVYRCLIAKKSSSPGVSVARCIIYSM